MFLLVLAGGLVRSTGSGMGCPDWPKCFDQWVPPTHESQLPLDYKEIHSARRGKKIIKFADLLESIGLNNKASEIRQDKSLLIEEPFNVRKTWTEYVNRVLGALTGVFAVLFFVSAFQFRRNNRRKFVTAFIGLFLIGFNGWLGSIVVATNLLPGVVSVHFIFAFLAAIFIMIATHTGFNMQIEPRSLRWKYMILIAVLITLIQIVLGTLVRENIDYLTKVDTTFRYNGLNEAIMNSTILFHKIWSWVFLVFNLFFIWLIRNRIGKSNLYNLQLVILICWVIQFGTGLVNIWYALPPLAQLIHIVLGSAIFGAQAYVAIAFFNNVKSPLKS